MTKNEILDIALAITEKTKDYPTLEQLAAKKISRDKIRSNFGNLAGLYNEISNNTKEIFDLARSAIRTPKLTKKRLVISTALTGSTVDKNMLNNIDAYCKEFNAELVVLVSVLNKNMLLDPVLRGRNIVVQDHKINEKLNIIGIKNAAKSIDPVSGLPRVGQRNGSFIAPSPKQRLKYVATGVSVLPHALMTTGALTKPNYVVSNSLINKSDYIADYDHVMGAIIVEVESSSLFHFRQIQ
jgi:hypothetical protein